MGGRTTLLALQYNRQHVMRVKGARISGGGAHSGTRNEGCAVWGISGRNVAHASFQDAAP
eukprot:4442080-Alexandrium_andersonii.AAC.1